MGACGVIPVFIFKGSRRSVGSWYGTWSKKEDVKEETKPDPMPSGNAKCGTFMACIRCGTVNWRTDAYLRHCKGATLGCRSCGCDEYRYANRFVPMRDRLYLLRWHLWEVNHVNRRGVPGADPYWKLKPWHLARQLWRGYNIMREYNIVQSEGDHERPGNIVALRAQLSRRDDPGSPSVDSAADVPLRSRRV